MGVMARQVEFFSEGDALPHTVVLGADFDGRHQMGIDHILYWLGVQRTEATGIEQRSMKAPLAASSMLQIFDVRVTDKFLSKAASTARWAQKTSTVTVVTFGTHYPDRTPQQIVKAIGTSWTGPPSTFASWDGDGFAIVAYGDRDRAFVRALASAITEGDLAIWTGRFSGNPFSPGGLAICRPSQVPDRYKREMLEADEERNRLRTAAKATGIYDRLEAANAASGVTSRLFAPFGYHALSPRWAEGFHPGGCDLETEHPVVFFLNPTDQQKAQHGWFTVEALDAWIEGRGPVIKEREAVPAR